MRLTRRSRFLSVLLALICVLFAQIVVAGYACPNMQISQAIASIAPPVATVSAHFGMPGCEDMDSDTGEPQLCQDHGPSRHQSSDKPAMPDVPPFIGRILVQAVSQSDADFASLAAPADHHILTRSTAPPLAIRNCCFRI